MMVNARGVRDAEGQTILQMQAAARATLIGKPQPITPIIFRLGEAVTDGLEALLDSRRTVAFDLDGTTRAQRYDWVRPDTAILVWDPIETGRITSGHQLFGSVSFNMFWFDGYRALDALDDNRDGSISGAELIGLAVWFDRNQDGASQPGEVVPIGNTRVASISVIAFCRDGMSLTNPAGLVTIDGRVLPTYDWTTEPLTPARAPSTDAPHS
jgi:hypothetical protein